MASKVLIVLGVALCLVQSLQAKPRGVIEDIIEEAYAIAKDAIENLATGTKSALEKAEADIEREVARINSDLKSTVESAENRIQGLGDRLVSNIDDLVKKAESDGLDASVCVEGKTSEAQEIERDATNEIQKCVSTADRVGEDVKSTFETEVNLVENSIDRMEKDILACLPPDGVDVPLEYANSVARCLVVSVDGITKLNTEDISLLTTQVEEASSKVVSAIETAANCVNDVAADAENQEEAVIEEVNTCIGYLSK